MLERDVIEIVRRELAQIYMGRVTDSTPAYRAMAKRFQKDTPFDEARLIHPYGFASRPPPEMECLLVPIGGEPTHVVVAGQNDTARPSLAPGEVAVYGPAGQAIFMFVNGKIRMGTADAASPVVLGDVLAAFLREFLRALLDAPSIGEGATGPVVLSPAIRAALTEQMEKYLSNPASNILGQKNFVDRGV